MEKDNPQLQLLKEKVGKTMKEGLSPYGHWIDGKLLEADFGIAKFAIEVPHGWIKKNLKDTDTKLEF